MWPYSHGHVMWTYPQGLSESQVGEEYVCLLDVADLTLHLLVHLFGVESDFTTGQRGLAGQSIEKCSLTRS